MPSMLFLEPSTTVVLDYADEYRRVCLSAEQLKVCEAAAVRSSLRHRRVQTMVRWQCHDDAKKKKERRMKQI